MCSMTLILHLCNEHFVVTYCTFDIAGIFRFLFTFFSLVAFYIECLYGALMSRASDIYIKDYS